ncbi:MAG: ribosomal-protein-alanine N-acetyltransferase [Halieaceae bacterium]|jgi:ribosomal-protein-alanine N-acetyltransferase
MPQPMFQTGRLLLRPFDREDAPRIQELAGDKRIADPTLSIPHPYPDGAAEVWIASHRDGWDRGTLASFAVTLSKTSELIGAISLMDVDAESAELGYWIGVPYWGMGYASEAASATCEFAFRTLKVHRVYARHLIANPASGSVLIKSGFSCRGNEVIDDWKDGRSAQVKSYERRKV